MAGKNTINGRLVRIYCCFAIPLAIIRKKHRPFLFHGGIGSRTRRGVSFCMGKASDRRPKGKEPEKRRGRKSGGAGKAEGPEEGLFLPDGLF